MQWIRVTGWDGEFLLRKDSIIGICEAQAHEKINRCLEAKLILNNGNRISVISMVSEKNYNDYKNGKDGILLHFLHNELDLNS